MMKFVSAKCPECGASLKLSKEEERVECEYCHNSIIVDDAIACYKLKVSGNVSVDGVTTNAELIAAANELLDMNEYLKAKRKFLEFSEKCPDNYQGWLGLLICRTRNFTIKDDNIMFENDVKKYHQHFLRVAPKKIKEEYFETIDRYFNPEKYKKMEEEERERQRQKELEEQKKKEEEERKFAAEEKEKRKEKRRENSIYKSIEKVSYEVKRILLMVWDGFLYLFGGIIVFGSILSFGDNIITNIFGILFGLSLFKIIYVKVEAEYKNIEKKHIKVARVVIPLLLLFMLGLVTPTEEVDSDSIESKNNVEEKEKSTNNNQDLKEQDKVKSDTKEFSTNKSKEEVKVEEKSKKVNYYINYNELGKFGKYMEFEKKKVIFYYFPDGKYNIEVIKLNEDICFLWIDYRNGYQNGNYGTAYNTKEMLKFTKSLKASTVVLDNSVHIYNSNNCNYKLTLIK